MSSVWMTSTKEVYHFSLRVEEKLRNFFDNKNSGRGRGGRSDGKSYGGWNNDQKNKDGVSSSNQNQRGTIPIISMIKIIEIREEEAEEKDLEEEASIGIFFSKEKKGIKNLSVPSAKEE